MPERFRSTLVLAGARIHVDTDHRPWHRYLQSHFGPLIVEGFADGLASGLSGGDPHLTVRASWEAHPLRSPSMRAERTARFPDRLGGSIVGSERELCWVQKLRGSQRLRLIASWSGERLLLEGVYRRKALKERLRTWLGASEAQRLFELTYPLVYYPLWFYLEATAGWQVLHASAARMPSGSAIVFAGLEGIGKTTLSLGCVTSAGGQLMADNLIWYNEAQVLGVPEPIRLHDASSALVRHASLKSLDVGKTQKGFFTVERAPAEPARPVAVLLPVFSPVTEIVSLDAEACADRMLATNALAGEVSPYGPFSAWMSLLRPIPARETRRRQTLVSLLRRCRCGVLRMVQGRPADAVRAVLEWAEGR